MKKQIQYYLLILIASQSIEIKAQTCPTITLSQLKHVASTNELDKEDEILGYGFSFEQEYTSKGNTFRIYVRCSGRFGNGSYSTYFETITHNITLGGISLGTHSQKNYLDIKNLAKKTCSKRQKKESVDYFENCDGWGYRFEITAIGGNTYYLIGLWKE